MTMDLEKIDLGSFGIHESDPLGANLSEAVKVDPAQHSQVVNLSKQSGVPEFAVEDNPSAVEQHLKLEQIDVEGLRVRAPKSADFVRKDFNNAVLAQEDVMSGVLESIETIFSGLGTSIGIGFKTQTAGTVLLGHEAATDRIDEIVPWSAMPLGMETEAHQLSQDFAEVLGVKTDEEYQALRKRGADQLIQHIQKLQERRAEVTPENMTLVEEGVRAGIESLANMLPATLAMIGTQGRAAPLFLIGAQTYTGSYADARAEGLPIDKSRWFASIEAAIEVGTELMPLTTLEKMLTGRSKGLSKDMLRFAVRELGTEQLATAGQSLNAYLFGLDAEMEQATPEERVEIQLRRQAVTAIATAIAGGAQASGVTLVNRTVAKLTATEQQNESQSEAEQRGIDQLNAQAEQSELKKHDVELFKQFVRESTGENDVNVYIDGAQTALYLQSKTRAEIEADPALKLLDNARIDARDTGADIEIAVDEFAGEIAGTEHFKQLRDHMTLNDQAVSPFRQEQHREETREYVTKILMDEAEQNTSEYVEAQEIYSQVRDQLIDTGTVSAQNASVMAQVVPAWATAHARRSGKSIAEVYADAGLTGEGPQSGERARLEGEQVLTQPGYHGSPHKFDRFDHSKMGTGEGAQAYGWGTYIAENPDVGNEYKSVLVDRELLKTKEGA
ncbi:MAG: hypothetical protein GY937_08690, partial [bacterium]|nr:hypothetical protein [bacterium]